MTDVRVPPNDMDAEGVVLGAVLEGRLDEVAHLLRGEHFYAHANQLVWQAACDLERAGRPVDVVTVAGHLRDRNQFDRVGGSQYLTTLAYQPSALRLGDTAARIVEKSRLRAIIAEAQQIAAEAYAVPDDVGAFVQTAEARMYAAAGQTTRELRAQTALEVMTEVVPEIGRRFAGRVHDGETTGFKSLDKRIGGLRGSRVYVVAARPGMGKTSLATQVMGSVANSESKSRGVFMASLEMPREQIGERLIAQVAQLDTRKVERGWITRKEWDTIVETGKGVGAWPLVIDDSPAMTVGMMRSSIRRAVRTLRERHDTGLGLVVIDYFQLINTNDFMRRGASTNDTLEALSKSIADGIAKEFDVPVMLLSQLNREVEKRPSKRPQLSDLRGSGALEQDAHTILFLFREDLYRGPNEVKDRAAEIIIAKCRGGRCGTLPLSYLEYCTLFVDDGVEDETDELEKYKREAQELGGFAEDIERMFP